MCPGPAARPPFTVTLVCSAPRSLVGSKPSCRAQAGPGQTLEARPGLPCCPGIFPSSWSTQGHHRGQLAKSRVPDHLSCLCSSCWDNRRVRRGGDVEPPAAAPLACCSSQWGGGTPMASPSPSPGPRSVLVSICPQHLRRCTHLPLPQGWGQVSSAPMSPRNLEQGRALQILNGGASHHETPGQVPPRRGNGLSLMKGVNLLNPKVC